MRWAWKGQCLDTGQCLLDKILYILHLPEISFPSDSCREWRVVCMFMLACRLVQPAHLKSRSSLAWGKRDQASNFTNKALHLKRAYSQTLKNQANHCIKLRPAHLSHAIQPHSKHQHPFLLRPLHKNRTPNRRRQRLTHHFIVTLRAA